MNVLVACEFSGIVRDAYRSRGHNAWSCDLLPCERDNRFHLQMDVREILYLGCWDLMIGHPPCTHLAASGASHFHKKKKRQVKALEFFLELLNAPVSMICLENPVSVISTRVRKADQI